MSKDQQTKKPEEVVAVRRDKGPVTTDAVLPRLREEGRERADRSRAKKDQDRP